MSNHLLCTRCQQYREPDEAYTTHVFTLSGTIRELDGSLFAWSVFPGIPPECEEIPPVPDYFASFSEVSEQLPPLPPSPELEHATIVETKSETKGEKAEEEGTEDKKNAETKEETK